MYYFHVRWKLVGRPILWPTWRINSPGIDWNLSIQNHVQLSQIKSLIAWFYYLLTQLVSPLKRASPILPHPFSAAADLHRTILCAYLLDNESPMRIRSFRIRYSDDFWKLLFTKNNTISVKKVIAYACSSIIFVNHTNKYSDGGFVNVYVMPQMCLMFQKF